MKHLALLLLIILGTTCCVIAQPTSIPSATPTVVAPNFQSSVEVKSPSMTVNEVLSANNQAVSQVATTFQWFAGFITIIVTLTGSLVTVMGFLAKKTADDFIKDWKDKLEKLETSTKDSERKLEEEVAKAQASAERAAEHEQAAYDALKTLRQTSSQEGVGEEDMAQVTEDLEGLLPQLNQGENNE